jgi:hypothetical protein
MRRVTCEECGQVGVAGVKGWRATLANDPWDDEPPEVAIYCPVCALREFGQSRRLGPRLCLGGTGFRPWALP